ncbi:MAG: replication initiator protein A [Desulfobacterales bacterium]|nr:replication initiator protein A [Desulfobacterales bacterium]
MNLAEFPFAVLSDKPPQVTKLCFKDSIIGRGGRIIPRTWTIVATREFGFPTRDDEKVYIALLQFSKEQGFESKDVSFTGYKILKLIGWPTKDGRYYRRLRLALYRLKTMTIIANNAWYNSSTREYETDRGFNIVDAFSLWGKDPYNPVKSGPFSRGSITWGQRIWQSIQNGNIKNLDTKFWFSLRSAIARRLHRYLDKKFYRDDIFRIELKKLAFEKLGMSRAYVPSKIKSLLDPACEELVDKGYLKTYRYDRKDNKEEILTFIRSKLGRQEEIALSEKQVELFQELVNRGLTKVSASRLLRNYSSERIKEKIELHDYLKSTNSHLVERNSAGYLRKAIEEDYTPPEGFITKAEREEKERLEQQKKTEQDLKDKQKRFDDWLAMSDEEKIKGDLLIWQYRYKREQGKEPTAEGVESKKQELISKLSTIEEKKREILGDTQVSGLTFGKEVTNVKKSE